MDKILWNNQHFKNFINKSFKKLLNKLTIREKILERYNYQIILKKWMIQKQKRWLNSIKYLHNKNGKEVEIKEFRIGDNLVRKNLLLVQKKVTDQSDHHL